MIVSKTPIRISMGAGGIDLPAFSSLYGAKFATASGSKYVHVMVNRHPEKVVWMGLYRAERADNPRQIRHKVVSKTLEWLDIKKNIEVVSISDVSSNSGVGTSSSFIVGLVNALHAYKGEYLWPEEIAREACYVERVLLGEEVGIQDQYAAALGGIIWLEVSKDGGVATKRLDIRPAFVRQLNDHILFFYTGIQRSSSKIQKWQKELDLSRPGDVAESMRAIQKVALEIRRSLENQDVAEFGRLMDEHWMYKRRTSRGISNPRIDRLYALSRKAGAIGGNLMGAGGGGHFMLVCPDDASKLRVSRELVKEGLTEVDMKIEMHGSKIIEM